jgi:hypothetical protein
MDTETHVSRNGRRHYSRSGSSGLLCGKWLPLPHPAPKPGTEIRDCKTCARILTEDATILTIALTHDAREHLQEYARVHGYTARRAAEYLLTLTLDRNVMTVENLRRLPTKGTVRPL